MKNLNKKNKGFTLIEVLVVIGIIAILASIVIIAINPKKHFDDAKQAQREANVNAILNAIGQYVVDNKGSVPSTLSTTAEEVDEALCNVLVTEYIGAIPTDPDGGEDGAAISDCTDVDADDVDYTTKLESDDHVTVCAINATPDYCLTR